MHTWFITGASSGFGHALAREVLGRGDAVVTASRNPDVDAGQTGRLLATRADVSDPAEVHDALERGIAAFGPITRVVSGAGFGALGAIEEQPDELIAQQIAVNLIGSINVVRAAVAHMRTVGGGRVFQFSSSGGEVADPGMSVYNATKFGIEGFLSSIAIEVAPFGIDVTLVVPGGSGTGFMANMVRTEPLPAYADGVLGQIRGLLAGDPAVLKPMYRVDPAKVAATIADAAATSPAPRRLVLGASAYESVRRELQQRIDELDGQRDLAYAADLSDA
ncbi:SDR family NAD(P)-dependent oxidoreductase [Actinoplanes sp. TBRC 11911]|uniref:SDR family NAD(P)-dependent oxidoreductase n=1 Tax=Actinoplanes sp. TBRC 11911 TaxID=2729386 RepID=UPI00145E5EAF|nr:SDR family NAD(P)-dependent oxidoreductase [Actinoplanes sp. TBRC 11911]NMO57763.1 SDR family NAD(P)-dependent oxidoreductase [Actinoplanes sp. TBRC 11911]